MNLTFKRFASFLMALVMIFSLLPSFETHVHAEEHPEEPAVQYTVKFLDADGTELQTILVEEGAMPAYTGAPLLKEGYAFVGWTPEIAAAAADAEYTAVYTEAQPIEEEPEIPSEPEIPQQSQPETPTYSEAYLNIQAWIDEMLNWYVGSTTATQAEIEAAVAGLNRDDLWKAQVEVYDIDAEAEATLTGSEQAELEENNAVLIAFANELSKYAAEANQLVSGSLTDTTIVLSNSGGTWTATGTSINGSVQGTKVFGSYFAKSSTLTIKNNKSEKAALYFKYKVTFQEGSNESYLQIPSGTTVASSTKVGDTHTGEYNTELDAGASLTIKLNAGKKGGDNTASIEITNISLVSTSAAGVATTFEAPAFGSYTIAYGSVTETVAAGSEAKVITNAPTVQYTLTANNSSGHKFIGWYDVLLGDYIAMDNQITFVTDKEATVKPIFVTEDTPVFGVGSATSASYQDGMSAFGIGATEYNYHTVTTKKYFTDLQSACDYAAGSNDKYIVLVSSGTLPQGNYVIPDSTTLLIPFDDVYTLYTKEPCSTSSYTKPTAHKTLTMASGANLIVNGALSVSGKHMRGAAGKEDGAAPTGPQGFIDMKSGSNITVAPSGTLYAFGYITGKGTVTAEPRSTVYELFQISDFRGGTQTTDEMLGRSEGVFLFSQYYVQNIEVPMTLKAGATEYSFTTIYMQSMSLASSIAFIGGEGSMFNISSGHVVKKYNGANDRLELEAHGDVSLSPITMQVATESVKTTEFDLPINSNITVNVVSGNITVAQDVAVLPGVIFNVASGATCTLGSGVNVYVYDADQWGTYVWGGNSAQKNLTFVPVKYAPSKTYTRTNADLVDAVFNVAGTIDASAGYLYTTESGAAINGQQGAVVKMNPGTQACTYQVLMNVAVANYTDTDKYVVDSAGSDVYVKIPITPAKLRNADGTYQTTVEPAEAVTTYNYCGTHDCWYTGECEICNPTVKYTITFLNEDGSAFKTIQVKEGATPDPETFPTKAGDKQYATYTFSGWDLAVNGAYDGKADTVAAATADATYKAIFTPGALMTYNVIFKDTDGKTLYTAENVAYGSKPNYEGITTKTVNCTTYTISVPQVAAVNGEAATLSYTVSWTEGETKHTEVTVDGKAPTCEETGLTNGTKCSVCGTTLTEQTEIPALKHDMKLTSEQVDAKCEVAGKTAVYTCANNCGKTEGGEEIPALKHDMKLTAEQVDAKCEVAGKTAVYTCANGCGKTEGGEEIPALKHDMKLTAEQVDAKCEVAGTTAVYTCANNCGKTEGGDEIPALKHDMKLTSEKVEAECEKAGQEAIYTCANGCGKTEGGDEIPALKHNMQLTSEKVDAKCEVAGKTAVYTCANGCGKTEGGEEIPALKHDMKLTSEKVDAKCEVAGKTAVYTCANGCGKTEGGDEIPALKHDMKLTAEQVDAKCEVAGKEAIYTCANGCGKTEGGDEIPALKHNMQLTSEKVDAKCEVAGKTAVYTCANGCGKTEGGEEIPALKHDMQLTTAKVEAECEKAGQEAIYTCANGCGKTEGGEEIPALKHDMQKTADQVDAKCEVAGKTAIYTCANGCGKTEGGEEIPALKHSYAVTYRNDGETHTKIETCSNDATHVIETAGQAHEYVNGECECGAKEPVPAGMKGDLDLDGDVDAADLTLLARHLGRIELLTDSTALDNADVNSDGSIDSYDLTKHARYIGKIITDWSQE